MVRSDGEKFLLKVSEGRQGDLEFDIQDVTVDLWKSNSRRRWRTRAAGEVSLGQPSSHGPYQPFTI